MRAGPGLEGQGGLRVGTQARFLAALPGTRDLPTATCQAGRGRGKGQEERTGGRGSSVAPLSASLSVSAPVGPSGHLHSSVPSADEKCTVARAGFLSSFSTKVAPGHSVPLLVLTSTSNRRRESLAVPAATRGIGGRMLCPNERRARLLLRGASALPRGMGCHSLLFARYFLRNVLPLPKCHLSRRFQ